MPADNATLPSTSTDTAIVAGPSSPMYHSVWLALVQQIRRRQRLHARLRRDARKTEQKSAD